MAPVYRIAEDALHLSDELMNEYPDYPWDDIRGFRNFVAHGYRNVDRDIAWGVVNKDIVLDAKSDKLAGWYARRGFRTLKGMIFAWFYP